MFKNLRRVIGADAIGRELERCAERVAAINALEPELRSLSDEALRRTPDDFPRQGESAQEDVQLRRRGERAEAYAADVSYGTNNEFGFDYLRDNMAQDLEARVQRGHHYAILDEVDNILIDEARTPLIISGPSHEDPEMYERVSRAVRELVPEDHEVSERDRSVALTEVGG